MRYGLAVLILFGVLPMINLLAAPAPDPSGILDIGPPPKGKTAEQYLKDQIEVNTHQPILNTVFSDPEVKKLPSVASMKDARPWLVKNLRIASEKGGRHLRFTFPTGKRSEQVIIINAFLRASISWLDPCGTALKCSKESVREFEKDILELEQRIKTSQDPKEAASYRDGINELRSIRIPALRAEIARLEQYAVIKWGR